MTARVALHARTETWVDLGRAAPPIYPGLSEAFRSTLRDIERDTDFRGLMHDHRYEGTPMDLAAARKWLAARFGDTDLIDRIVVTNGTKNAVLLTLSELVEPREAVATEALSALNALSIAHITRTRILGLAIDELGIAPEAFEDCCEREAPKALYCVPTLHNPTSSTINRDRQAAIVAIARRHGVAIVEDDICGLLHPAAPAPFAQSYEQAWYATGLGKSVVPGLRIGFLVAPTPDLARRLVTRHKSTSTWFAAPLTATLAGRWITDGTAAAALRYIRDEMPVRQEMAAEILCGADVSAHPSSLTMWMRFGSSEAAQELLHRARDEGINLGDLTSFVARGAQKPSSLRLCLGNPATRGELADALDRVARLL